MLGLLAGATWREPDCFRFSVKCDRATNAAIERAALAAGLSVNAFVQAHFDRILDAPAIRPSGPAFDALGFAHRHGLHPNAARLWGVMRAESNAAGLISRTLVDLGRAVSMTPSAVQYQLGALARAELLSLVSGGLRGSPSLWRVLEPE